MNSPWGRRGEICKSFGWTYDYLMWGISWVNVQMMIADQASIEYDTKENKNTGKRLETKQDIINYVNSHNKKRI